MVFLGNALIFNVFNKMFNELKRQMSKILQSVNKQ